MSIKPKFLFIGLLWLIIINTSCSTNNENDSNSNSAIYPELTPPVRVSINQIQEKDSINGLIISDVKKKLIKNSEIQNDILKFNFENKWSICYRVNADKKFDIFVLEQINKQNLRSLIIVTSQKDQPENIFSAVIVGLENYSENSTKIETENWSTSINSDLSFKILKQYEAIIAIDSKKMIDLSENNSTRTSKTEVEETYQIKEDGTIEFINKAIFSSPISPVKKLSYRAVIAFKMINDENDDPMNEEWMLNNIEIQNACLAHNILYIQVYDNFNSVLITNESGITLDTIDISFVTEKTQKGYVLIHSKMDPSFVDFSDKNTVLKAISDYFNIELMLDD